MQGPRLRVPPAPRIYGGLASSWDYGPLGVEFQNNVKRAWWKKFLQRGTRMQRRHRLRDSDEPLQDFGWRKTATSPNFNDPLMDCKACKARFPAAIS